MDCQKFFPWMMQIYIFSTAGIAFILGILLVIITEYLNDDGYLAWTLDFNWDKQYIKEINFLKEDCQTGYETLNIGAWSGFGDGIYVQVSFNF